MAKPVTITLREWIYAQVPARANKMDNNCDNMAATQILYLREEAVLWKTPCYKSSDCSAEAIRRSSFWPIRYYLEKLYWTHTHTHTQTQPCGACAPRVKNTIQDIVNCSATNSDTHTPPNCLNTLYIKAIFIISTMTWFHQKQVLSFQPGSTGGTIVTSDITVTIVLGLFACHMIHNLCSISHTTRTIITAEVRSY